MNRTLMATASALALMIGVPATMAQTQGQGTTTPPRTQQNQPATQGGSGTGTNSTVPQSTTGTSSSTSPSGTPTTQQAGQVDTQKLIGRNVTNAQNETVGEIESLLVGQDGQVRAAILGVGGFLGIGERHVAVNWDQLSMAQNGERVTINMSKDQLRALPEFRYSENQRRGGMFTDTGPYTRAPGAPATPGTMSGSSDNRGTVSGTTGTGAGTTPGAAKAPGAGTMAMNTPGTATGTPITGDHPLSASNLIGLNLRNTANENIGEVKDVILGADGKVREVIVGVGGFLGMGERYVAISWDQLKMSRTNDNKFLGQVGYTRDQLREMPVWRQDRNTGWTRG